MNRQMTKSYCVSILDLCCTWRQNRTSKQQQAMMLQCCFWQICNHVFVYNHFMNKILALFGCNVFFPSWLRSVDHRTFRALLTSLFSLVGWGALEHRPLLQAVGTCLTENCACPIACRVMLPRCLNCHSMRGAGWAGWPGKFGLIFMKFLSKMPRSVFCVTASSFTGWV